MTPRGVNTTDWAMSLKEQGNTVDGVYDIHQCIYIILTTMKGSDPFRPTFGCDIYSYIDKPVNSAIPNMVRSIIDAIRAWETRVEIQTVRYRLTDTSTLLFQIEWTLSGSAISQITDFELFLNGNPGNRYPSFNATVKYLSTEDGYYLTDEDGNYLII